jgi:hypothetical protein
MTGTLCKETLAAAVAIAAIFKKLRRVIAFCVGIL